MTSFHFLRPGWLVLLPPLLALLLWLWRRQLSSRGWQAICDPELLPHLLLGRSKRRANWPFWLLLGALLLSIFALAGPTWEKQPQPLFRRQSALVILLDLSRSMAAADLKPDRLQRARLKTEDILRRRREGQTALIAFAGDAFTVTPLTDDAETIKSLLKSLEPDLMPIQGSEPQRAIQLAMELLRQAGLKHGQVLLISDEDRPEKALGAARQLKDAGFNLSVLGIGTPDGAPVPVTGGGFLKDNEGNLVLPKLNETGLRRLAAAGGGNYRRLSIDESDVRELLNNAESHRLDTAEKTAGKTGVLWRDEGVWLLWPLALLAALAFRRGWLFMLLLLLLPHPAQAFSWTDLWQRPDQQAAAAYKAERFEEAGKLFQDQRWKAGALYRAGHYDEAAKALEHPESADDWYNRGNAQAKNGDLQKALQSYEQALMLNPNHDDARANNEMVKKALRQQQRASQPSEHSSADQPKGDQEQAAQDEKQGQNQQQPGEETPADKPEQKGNQAQTNPSSAKQDGQARAGKFPTTPA